MSNCLQVLNMSCKLHASLICWSIMEYKANGAWSGLGIFFKNLLMLARNMLMQLAFWFFIEILNASRCALCSMHLCMHIFGLFFEVGVLYLLLVWVVGVG